MRQIILGGIFALGVLLQGVYGWGQPARTKPNGIFFAPNAARLVTIYQQRTAVATLTFPKGTFLDVTYVRMQPATNNGVWIFNGDFSLKAQPASSAPGRPPGRTAAEIMSQAPFVLNMKDADVVVQNITP